MGQTCGRYLPLIPRRHSLNLLVVGLEKSGKTSVVSSLQLIPWEPQPTTHFSKPTLVLYKDTLLRIYDLGGRADLRKTWTEYLPEVHALVFVVDAAEQSGHRDAAVALRRLLQQKFAKDKHALVLANKQDLPGALSSEELAWSLSLEQYPETLVQVYPCKATLHAGARAPDWRMQAGLDWLIDAVTSGYSAIDRRVHRDRASRAKAALQAESLKIDTDPFSWKTRHNRNAGRSFAQATLAAFEQATSRRWGGTVVPAKRNIPSDIDEGEDEEQDAQQETETAGITTTAVFGSERSFSVNSDGEATTSQEEIQQSPGIADESQDDTLDLVKARWSALGLLWPDQKTCSSVLSAQASKNRPTPEFTQAPSRRVGILGKFSNSARKGSAAGGSTTQPISRTYVEQTEILQLEDGSMAGECGPSAGDSPRGRVKLPPVKAWGSFKQEQAGYDQSTRVLKSAMRPKSQPGNIDSCKAEVSAAQNGKSASSPGQEGMVKVLQFK